MILVFNFTFIGK